MAAKAPTGLRLRITATAEKIIRSGHPWLFSDSILEQNQPGQTGDLAIIYDRKDRFLAVGLFDADSPIRVRMLHSGKPLPINWDWYLAQTQKAVARRSGLFDSQTTGYRCINGESDGWPGLILDRYDTSFVLKLYTAAWLPRIAEVVKVFKQEFQPERLVLRLSRNIQEAAHDKWRRKDGDLLHGAALDGPAIFLENGVRFEADILQGQKTGFFLDQRENRRKVGSFARNRVVLNAFSFTGGFSLYAVRGGAKSVTDLDISPHALAGAKRNYNLNRAEPSVAASRHEAIQANAFDWLNANFDRKFDLVIIDPPSLAKREAERSGAIDAYRRLVSSGLQHLNSGGILVACSCSAHVSAPEFFDAVRSAVKASNRSATELETTGHAPDHPATFKEAEYLKGIYFRF